MMRGRCLKAEITVFLSLCGVLVISLLLCVTEAARTQCARWYLIQALNSSVDSLFSQYHRELWDHYRLLGLESYSPLQLCDETEGFLKPYLQAKNFFPMTLSDISLLGQQNLTGEDGEVFEEEVLAYMHYGIAAQILGESKILELTKLITEGTAADEISGEYEKNAALAVLLEKRIGAIQDCLKRQQELYYSAESDLENHDAEGFYEDADALENKLEELPDLIAAYEKEADEVREKLAESRELYEEKYALGELGQESYDALREDIGEYDSYVNEDGARRTEIRGFLSRAVSDIDLIEAVISEVEEIEEILDSYDPDEDEDNDGPDEEALFEEAESHFSEYDLLKTDYDSGVRDEETEGILEGIRGLVQTGLMELVLPKDAKIDSQKLDLEDCPGSLFGYDQITGNGITDRLYLTEYVLKMFDTYGRGQYWNSRKYGSGHLEAEYILYGKESDQENLRKTVEELTAVRTGLNMLFLMRDPQKRNEARALAASIAAVTGFAPIISVLAFMILCVWALAQAVCDVRDLLSGKTVPLLHDRNSFYLSLDGLLEFGRKQVLEEESSAGGAGTFGSGLDYRDYLRIFLYLQQNGGTDFRCMDMIQMYIRLYAKEKQKDFLIDRCVRSLELGVRVKTGHLFLFAAGTAKTGGLSGTYEIEATSSYSY